ncbi:hypothetical protein SF1_42600 [Sphingobacterium faecium NBRC 15299]|nr:hypothetical protein SF1_42600 [Sphingobacterium faecium NBRC 15299]
MVKIMKHIFYIILVILIISCKNKSVTTEKNRDILTSVLHGDTLIYNTFSKSIIIEDLRTNNVIKKLSVNDLFYYSPIINSGKLYFSESNKKFVCYDLTEQRNIWELETISIVKSVLIRGNEVILNLKNNGFIILDKVTGKEKLKIPYTYSEVCAHPDVSPYSMEILNGNLYVANWNCNSISMINLDTGKLLKKVNLGSGYTYLTVIGNKLFVGLNGNYNGGKIFILDGNTLNIEFSERVNFEDRMKPLIWKGKLIYYTFDNQIYLFDPVSHSNEVLLKLSEKDNLSGSKMILSLNNLYFHTVNFELLEYNLEDKKLKRLGIFGTRKIDNIFLKDGKVIKIF